VRDRLRETTGGCTGLRVAADFSHYLHQIGNPHFPQWPAIASGELNLDPLDPDNLISRRIVEAGLVGNGHLRAAVPNDLPRGRGSIQYPIADPRGDAATAALPNGGMDRPWEPARLRPWDTSDALTGRIPASTTSPRGRVRPQHHGANPEDHTWPTRKPHATLPRPKAPPTFPRERPSPRATSA
jgi:hypothetical protein